MTQKLIHLLSELEITDRQRMSSDGKESLDSIWKLLGQPTYAEIEANKKKHYLILRKKNEKFKTI